ncbi:unnamed protein product [Prorocentrum cordatum]|uniref:Uncharacterized protein n=1 Tax=Prorocentrum cordatum TaxID=2364126 RepID=A0ABN9QJL7_9DINO|nr:unnamed protein product [Polarella glacialis]
MARAWSLPGDSRAGQRRSREQRTAARRAAQDSVDRLVQRLTLELGELKARVVQQEAALDMVTGAQGVADRVQAFVPGSLRWLEGKSRYGWTNCAATWRSTRSPWCGVAGGAERVGPAGCPAWAPPGTAFGASSHGEEDEAQAEARRRVGGSGLALLGPSLHPSCRAQPRLLVCGAAAERSRSRRASCLLPPAGGLDGFLEQVDVDVDEAFLVSLGEATVEGGDSVARARRRS